MFNFTTVVFDGTSPTFYFTNTSGWNISSSKLWNFTERSNGSFSQSNNSVKKEAYVKV